MQQAIKTSPTLQAILLLGADAATARMMRRGLIGGTLSEANFFHAPDITRAMPVLKSGEVGLVILDEFVPPFMSHTQTLPVLRAEFAGHVMLMAEHLSPDMHRLAAMDDAAHAVEQGEILSAQSTHAMRCICMGETDDLVFLDI